MSNSNEMTTIFFCEAGYFLQLFLSGQLVVVVVNEEIALGGLDMHLFSEGIADGLVTRSAVQKIQPFFFDRL